MIFTFSISFPFRRRYRSKTDENGNLASNGSAGDVLPADLLVKRYNDITAGRSKTYLKVDIGNLTWKNDKTMEIIRRYKDSEAVLYVGTFSSDTLGSDYITLSGGQKIFADVPVTIDLTQIHGVGNVYLHTRNPEKVAEEEGTETFLVLNGDTNYQWVMPSMRGILYGSEVFKYSLGS